MKILAAVLLTYLGLAYAKSIPSYLHVCKRTDPDLNQCVKNSVEDLRQQLKDGIPELKVPPIEPLYIEELVATEGSGLQVVTRDLKVYGGSNFTIKSLNVDLKTYEFSFEVVFPHLSIEGKYNVDGKIIMIPIKGNGDMKCDVYDPTGALTFYTEIVDKDGVDHIRFTKAKVTVGGVSKGKIHLDNLFGGDKLIGEVINNAINLNFQYFVQELKPIIEDTLSKFAVETANTIVEDFPLKEVFPE